MYPDLREYLGLQTDVPTEGTSEGGGMSLSMEGHAACDRFETALRRGDHPRLEAMLDAASPAERDAWFRELLPIELEFFQETGEPIRLQDYVTRFPAFQRLVEETFLNPEIVAPPQFASYRILERLGSGGMGLVCLGQHVWTGRRVAVKLLARKWCGYPQLVERFLRELQLLGSLGNENIVRVYDGGRFGRTYWFAMEYIHGSDLQTLVDRNGPLPIGVACEVIRQAACGLRSLAERRLVHRDIKPGNLILEESTAIVRLLDLGLARRERGTGRSGTSIAGATVLTQPGAVVGTPEYMAPEQWTAPTDAGPEADIYGLGGTLYFLLSGRLMLESTRGAELNREESTAGTRKRSDMLREAAERGEIPPLTEIHGVPAELDAVFQRMVARNPADRFRTPSEVVAELEPFADAETLRRYCVGHLSADTLPSGAAEENSQLSVGRSQQAMVPTLARTAKPGSSRLHATTPSVSDSTQTGWTDKAPESQRTSRFSRRWWLLGTAAAIVGGGTLRQLLTKEPGRFVRENNENKENDAEVVDASVTQKGTLTETTETTRFLSDWATLPGADGTWWFDETPWMLPGLRTTLARRFLDAVAKHADVSELLYAMDPDRLYDLRQRTLQVAQYTANDPNTAFLATISRYLLEMVLSMNRDRTTPDSALDEDVAARFRTLLDEFGQRVSESELSADERYTIALFQHKIASITPEPDRLNAAQTAYMAAITAYDKLIAPGTTLAAGTSAAGTSADGTGERTGTLSAAEIDWFRALRRRCLVDYGRLAAEQLRDWAKMSELFRAAQGTVVAKNAVNTVNAANTTGGMERINTQIAQSAQNVSSASTAPNVSNTTGTAELGYPDFLLIESFIIEGVAAAAISPGDGGGNDPTSDVATENGGEVGRAAQRGSTLERYSASVNCFRRVTRRLDTGNSTPGRLSTGLLAQCYEREAWVRMGFWMVRQARSDFERALGLRETIRAFQQRGRSGRDRQPGSGGTSETVGTEPFSPEELLLFHNRHGIAMAERYLGNHGKAYNDYGGLLEEMWRRYGRIVLQEAGESGRGSILPDEARDFFERLSNSSERRGDMVLYHPFMTSDPVLRLARYAEAASLYDDAIHYAVDPKSRRVMRWKQAVLESLVSLDDPTRRDRALRLVANLPAMDATEQKLLASEFYRAVLLSQTANAILAMRTSENENGTPRTAETTAETTASAEPLRELIRDFWRNSATVTAHRRERLEILMLAGSTLLEMGAGDSHNQIAPLSAEQRVADVTLVHREVLTAFRNEFRQLVDVAEILPYLRPFHDQMIRTLLSIAIVPRMETSPEPAQTSIAPAAPDASAAPTTTITATTNADGTTTAATATAVERLRRQLSGDGTASNAVVSSSIDPIVLKQIAELIPESRAQQRNEMSNAILFWFAPDSWLMREMSDDGEIRAEAHANTAPDIVANTGEMTETAPDSDSSNGMRMELKEKDEPQWYSTLGIAIRWRIAGVPELELLPLDFGRREILRATTPLRETSESGQTILRWLSEESHNPTPGAGPLEIFWNDVPCWGDCSAVRQAITPAHWTFHFGEST